MTVASKTITVEFGSGYETDVTFDMADLSTEYWVEVTQRQNPYDASDEPIAIIIQGRRITLDSDGGWMVGLDEYLGI